MRKIYLLLFLLSSLFIFFGCKNHKFSLLDENEVSTLKTIVKKETIFTEQYDAKEVPQGFNFIKLPLAKQEEIATLFNKYNESIANPQEAEKIAKEIRTVLKDKKLEKGLSKELISIFRVNSNIRDRIKAKSFKYTPGELSLIKTGTTANFIYDVPSKKDYNELEYTSIKKFFNSETNSLEYIDEGITKLKKTFNDEYSIEVKTDIILNCIEFKTKDVMKIDYSKDVYKSVEKNKLDPNVIDLSKHLEISALVDNKWEPVSIKAGQENFLPKNTTLRIKVINVDSTYIPLVSITSANFELDNDNTTYFKLNRTAIINLSLPKKIITTFDNNLFHSIKYNCEIVKDNDQNKFGIIKGSTVDMDVILKEHTEISKITLIDKDGVEEEIIPEKPTKPIDNEMIDSFRKYKISYKAQKHVTLKIEVKKIIQTMTLKGTEGCEDFATDPMKYIESMNIVDLKNIESGTKVEITFKAVPEGKVHLFKLGSRKIKVVNNKVEFICKSPTQILYGHIAK